MNAELSFKIGLLLGKLDPFLDSVCPIESGSQQIFESDIEVLRKLSADVARFFSLTPMTVIKDPIS